MQPISISKQTARRYVMGRQGLWPGRRWTGAQGVVEALNACEALQLDPLNVAARSHDIALWSRVVDYQPEFLERAMYGERKFFEYGGALFVYPMHELPYWRQHMRGFATNSRWSRFAEDHPEVMDGVRAALRERGPLGNRDFAGGEKRFQKNYRGSKDTSLALYTLWITGETMVHQRQRFEKVYDFREHIAPPEHQGEAAPEEAWAYFARKWLAFAGLARERGWSNSVGNSLFRKVDKTEGQAWLDLLVEQGAALPIKVEGWKEVHYAPGEDAALLDTLESGGIPAQWQPLVSTEEEAVFLAPLEIVSARGRALKLFDFDYVWEVYKPAEQRRWGYYTIPVLYGDRLVARMDPRLDRATGTLRLMGFWLEGDAQPDGDFPAALARGLLRFARMTGAKKIDVEAARSAGIQLPGGDSGEDIRFL